MIMIISITNFMLAIIVTSCMSAAIACLIVYFILYNTHDEEIAKLSKELEDTKAELKTLSGFRCLYNRYRKYKEYEGNSSPRSEDFLNWQVLDDDL